MHEYIESSQWDAVRAQLPPVDLLPDSQLAGSPPFVARALRTLIRLFYGIAHPLTRWFATDKRLIKGGGAALTREKIIAEASDRFVCIIDAGKQVAVLGTFPLPVEVIPMARSLVARRVVALTGGQPVWRQGTVTDNGNIVLDIHGLRITDPCALETALNQIPGVVSVGLFARRAADVVIVGGPTVAVF